MYRTAVGLSAVDNAPPAAAFQTTTTRRFRCCWLRFQFVVAFLCCFGEPCCDTIGVDFVTFVTVKEEVREAHRRKVTDEVDDRTKKE